MTMPSARLIEIAWVQFWQLTVTIGLVALLARLMGKKHPHLAYALWMVALLKCLVPPLGDFSRSLWHWLPAENFGAETQQVTAISAPDMRSENATDQTEPDRGRRATRDAGGRRSGHLGDGAVQRSDASGHGESPSVRRSVQAEFLQFCKLLASHGGILMALWLCGALLLVGMAWGHGRERRWLLDKTTTSPTDPLERLLIRLERQLAIRPAVSLLIADCPIGPAVSGIRHPEIYLPRRLTESLSEAQLEALLAHELIHVRRGDVWTAYVQFLMQAVWWFHPAVWWMNREIARHRERCCDEEVLASLSGDRVAYARCLVDVLAAQQSVHPLPGYPGAHPVEITVQRLEEIMNRPNMIHRRTPAWCWSLAALLAVFTVALPGGQPTIAANQPPAFTPAPASPPALTTPAIGDSAIAQNPESNPAASNPVTSNPAAKSAENKAGEKSVAPPILKYGDGKADGKRSLAGSGEMIRFELPDGIRLVRGIKIHGARYGYPQPPNEDFEISFVKDDFSGILHTETAPYSLFHRGNSKWVNVKFKGAIELPKSFWLVLNFHAESTKGVYVSYDTSTKGVHSRIGLPGDDKPLPVNFGGDWMVQVITATK